jgi:2-polyprenyl-3-methyl-5-hydroxy-6-metoxy-1,4-benzoquinol methylase
MKNESNRLTDHYDSKYIGSNYKDVKKIPIVKKAVDRFQMAVKIISKEKGKYLEIGAGNGNVALSVIENFDELVLTELSEKRAKELRKLFQSESKVKIIQNNLDYENLPFNEGHFDVIAMIAVIEHLIDPIQSCEKLFKLLKPDGKLIVDTPNIAKITRRFKLFFGYFPSTASTREGLLMYDKKTPTDLYDEGHLHYFTFRSLHRLLIERIGFKKIEYYGYGSLKTTKIPGILCRLYPSLFSEVFIVATK